MNKLRILFVSFFPNAVADFLMAPYDLKAFVLQNEYIRQNCEIDIANFSVKKNTDLAFQKVNEGHYDIVAFSCYTWNIALVLELSQRLDKNYLFIFGGPEISETNGELLFNDIQNQKYAIVGEGEESFRDLILHLLEQSLKIEYSYENANTHILKQHAEISDLSTVPSIYEEVFPKKIIRFRETLVETQRGCLYRCAYCNGNKGFTRIRYFPIERVFKDIKVLLDNEPSEIRFIDSMFASDKKRANQILEYLYSNLGENVPLIYIEGDVHTISEDLIDIITRFKEIPLINNCDSIIPNDKPQYFTDMLQHYNLITVIGVQSFHKQSLNAINRRFVPTEKFNAFIQYCNQKNILLKIDMILGLPFETLDTYFSGLKNLVGNLKNSDHFVAIYVLKIIPNTKLICEYEKFDISFNEITHNVISTNGMNENEYYYAKCITAIVFRLINSPLRNVFIKKCEALGIDYVQFAKDMFDYLQKHGRVPEKMLDRNFDDYYWHYLIFEDLKHQDVLNYIQAM
jgi:radical SAM superfamily enzyme YgiQ (UPF0313 family)